MKSIFATLVIATLMLVGGCSLQPATPAASEAPEASEAAGDESGAGVARVGPGTSNAVLVLLAQASRDVDEGRLEAAGASLERALRIEPDNAVLWHYLARLRLRQGAEAQAIQLATKSNALAGADARLREENLRLIAFARERLGAQSVQSQ